MGTVKLLADKVRNDFFASIICHSLTDFDVQQLNEPRSFSDLKDEDKDLTLFTITKLTLPKSRAETWSIWP